MRKELKKFKIEKAFQKGEVYPKPKPFCGYDIDFFYEPFKTVEEDMCREDMIKILTTQQKLLVKSLIRGDSIKDIYQLFGLDRNKLNFMIKEIQNQIKGKYK